ncbi:hypothetical protein L596_015089 [Steinernema carpocapsae]|uniref:Negative elongation factor E n=1 Tax=Steinernema carpocapsae TaxID=34508 RepID=A0A4U5NET2_STECR|nr:hypothetical protein L596_015089 [Steinernema carpocapsae]
MIQAPLTTEEKYLKEKFEQLKAIKKAISTTKNPAQISKEAPKSADRVNKRSNVEVAAVAAEEVKKKIISGAITLSKASEKSTFKRAKLPERRPSLEKTPSISEAGSSLSGSESGMFFPSYSSQEPRFPRNQQSAQVPTRGPTLYVRGIDLAKEVLEEAFGGFGSIMRCYVEDRRKSAFITFTSTEQAEEAMNKMDDQEIDGRTIRVSFARRQNQSTFKSRNQRGSFNSQRTIPDSTKQQPGLGLDKRLPEGPIPLRRWAPTASIETSAPTTPVTPNPAPTTPRAQFQKFVPASDPPVASPASSDRPSPKEKESIPARQVVTYDDSCPFD